jgi:hypothetical protein
MPTFVPMKRPMITPFQNPMVEPPGEKDDDAHIFYRQG